MYKDNTISSTFIGYHSLFSSSKTTPNQAENGMVFGVESTGKETDCETGFSYFGARYYDPTLLTSWTAVDPMADKYPSLSPYNYCAWNPVKLVDPDGRKIDPASEQVFSQAIEDIGTRKEYYLKEIDKAKAKINEFQQKGKTNKIDKLNKVIDNANGCIETLENALSDMKKMDGDEDITFRFEHKIVGEMIPEPRWTDDSHMTIYYDENMPNSGSLVHESIHGFLKCYGPNKSTIPQEIDAYKAQYSMGAPLPNSTFTPSNVNGINGNFIKGIHFSIKVRTANGYKMQDYYPYTDKGIRPLPNGVVL